MRTEEVLGTAVVVERVLHSSRMSAFAVTSIFGSAMGGVEVSMGAVAIRRRVVAGDGRRESWGGGARPSGGGGWR
jgi:hypothetical protein